MGILVSITLALVLSGSSSLFPLAPSSWLSSPWFLVLPGLPPGPPPGPLMLSLLLLGPFLSGSFSNLFFRSKVGNVEEWGKGEGKGDEEGREVGCNGVCLCLSLPVNAYLVPHTHVHMNCNVIKYLIKRIFEQ